MVYPSKKKVKKVSSAHRTQVQKFFHSRKIYHLGLVCIFCLMLLFSGCDSWEDAKNKVKYGTDGINPNSTKTIEIDPGVYAPEKFTNYFTNQKESVLTFIEYSDKFIFCSIPDVKDEDISKAFKLKYKSGVEVKLLFDMASSFTNCDIACVPVPDSKYNSLYGYGIDIRVGTLNTKFCVNELGTLWFSSNGKEITETHIFYNKQIAEIYSEHFLDLYD